MNSNVRNVEDEEHKLFELVRTVSKNCYDFTIKCNLDGIFRSTAIFFENMNKVWFSNTFS